MHCDQPTPSPPSLFPPGHPDAPPAPAPALPPGMVWGLTADGSRVPAYAVPAEQPAHQPVSAPDPWPKRMVAGGGATAAVLAAIGYAGPGLSQVGHAVETAGIGIGIAAASTGALVLLVKGGLNRQASGQVNVSVNVTNTAHGGNATATARGRRR